MLSEKELIDAIKTALEDSVDCASQFDMNFEIPNILKCPIRNLFDCSGETSGENWE